MKEENKPIHQLIDDVKEYANLKSKHIGLSVTEKSSKIVSGAVLGMMIGGFIILCISFASLAFAFWVSARVGSNSLGFLLVAALYLLVSYVLFLFRAQIMKPIINLIISSVYDGEED